MMEVLSLEEKNIIKYMRYLFRLKQELNYTETKDKINLFTIGKDTKAIKDRALRGIKNLLEHGEEKNYYT